MRAWAVLAGLLAIALAVDASTLLRQDVLVSPSAAIPVTLAAGTAGSTTLGSSQTSATTTGATLPIIGTAQVLKVVHGTAAWTVQMQLVSVTGQGALDSITLSLVGGATQNQVVVSLGSVTQSIGTAVSLPSVGPDIQVRASGTCLGSCVFTLRILVAPSASSLPLLSLPYVLTVT